MAAQPPEAWPERTLLARKREYREGFDRLLGLAQRELRVFDADLSELRIDAPRRIEVLRQFLLKSPSNRLYIALHDPEFVKRYCPRLLMLLGTFSGKMFVHRVHGDAARVQDCFVLCDSVHVVRRVVRNQARGVLLLNDFKEAHAMRERFNEIWESSVTSVSANTVGL